MTGLPSGAAIWKAACTEAASMAWSKVTSTGASTAASSLAAGLTLSTCGGSVPAVAISESRLVLPGAGVAVRTGVGLAVGAVVAAGSSVVPGRMGVVCPPPHAEASRVRRRKAWKSKFFFIGFLGR